MIASQSDEPAWFDFSHMVFDVDGTLLNSNIAHVWSWQDAFEHENLFFPHLTMFLQIGLPGKQIIDKLAFAFPDRSTAERVRQHAKTFYRTKYVDLVAPLEDTDHLLGALVAQKKKLYAITSAAREETDSMFNKFQLDRYFDCVLTADDLDQGKPTPEPFDLLKKKIASSSPRIISFGDSPYDLAASRAAGIPFVYLGAGGFPREWFSAAFARFLNIKDLNRSLPKAVRLDRAA